MADVTILASDRDVKLVANTAAKDLYAPELDQFIHMCRQWRLDPLRKQIYALVYSKDNPKKRRVTYITGIDGYRAIADRTGNYRPGQRSVETADDLRDPVQNPIGIVSATASVWKFVHGEWHEFSETVYWDEYAPMKEVWENDQPSGKFILDRSGQWAKMGRVMLQKCAEAQALRRGWPDDLSGLYVDSEMDRSSMDDMIDITPHEQAERAASTERQELLGGPSIIFDFCDGEKLQSVPMGKVHDRVMEYAEGLKRDDNLEKLAFFMERNVAAFRQFWTHNASDALGLKKELEELDRTNEGAAE